MVLLNFLTFDLQSLSFFIMIEKRIPSLGIEPGVEFMLRVEFTFNISFYIVVLVLQDNDLFYAAKLSGSSVIVKKFNNKYHLHEMLIVVVQYVT